MSSTTQLIKSPLLPVPTESKRPFPVKAAVFLTLNNILPFSPPRVQILRCRFRMTSYGLPHHDSKPSSSLRVTPLTVRRHSALLADSCQLTANSLQLTADSFYLLTIFLTTVIDPSRSLRITPFIPCHYDAFRSPLLVTLSSNRHSERG